MALADTKNAIGKVTKLLIDRLNSKTALTVAAGRPEPGNGSDRQLNIFLYEASFDPSLKNLPLDEGQPAPLWLVLKYILTAFDDAGNSDTIQAHEYLGQGIRALQELSFLPLTSPIDAEVLKALKDNPEPLKITFDETPSDLLSKLMQGSDEKYRFSIGFQVRPVMIATGEPSSYSLLVGVDYTTSPYTLIGEEGIHIPVIPSMGPRIIEISPPKFEVNSTLTILGNDLNLSGISVMLGQTELAVTAQQPNKLQCVANGAIASGSVISAGSHPVSVVQTLPSGRRRSSNLLIGELLPTLETATPGSLHAVSGPPSGIAGNIEMTGALLGREEDDIFVALYKDGEIVRVFDGPFTFAPDQSNLTLQIEDSAPVPSGNYRIILRINGQQAKNSPEVSFI
ncbi:MAG: Pvc16 family protein [Nitrospirota bacterium]